VKEVSCKVIAPVVREAERCKFPPTALTEGTPYSLAHLRNGRERITWNEFIQIMANARRLWTEEQLVEIGSKIVASPLMLPFTIVARILFTPRDFYFYINKQGEGVGSQLFTHIVSSCRDVGPNQLEIELITTEGYPVCREFHLLTKGAFQMVPAMLWLPRSEVEMVDLPNGVRYHVKYPDGGGLPRRFLKAVAWPFTARTAARQLMEANHVLETRYQELDNNRLVLANQATQLRTAHRISQLIHGDLDLSRVVPAVADAFIDAAQMVAVDISLWVDLDGKLVKMHHRAGAQPEDDALEFPIESRGRKIGDLRLWSSSDKAADVRELMQSVLPTVAMALENALTYQVLADYRENLERKVVERTTELVAARDALTATVQRLEEAQQARDRIFANVNHEIRTPLSLVLLAVAAIRERLGSDERIDRYLQGIEAATRRLLRLVDELLLIAQGQEKKLQLERSSANLSAMVHAIFASWEAAARHEGLNLSAAVEPGVGARVDALAFERILTNLLSNAIKFTPRGGTIQVELRRHAADVVLEVRDTGIGISDEFRPRIFGRFEKGRPALRRGASGSGIGLSLVKELVDAHEGSVTVESPPGGGSLFRVILPAGERADAPPAPEPALAPEHYGVGVSAGSEPALYAPPTTAKATVLVAEDDVSLGSQVARLLATEYRVILAPDGLAALSLCETHHPDLLITDVSMPGMDGIELTRRFRAQAGNRLAPVLLISAYADLGDRLAGLEAGAVDYIVKPFNPQELRARVRSQLAMRELALKLHASEQLAALGTLSAGLAHEMRNPANAIVNAVEPLRELLPADLTTAESPTGQLIRVLADCAEQLGALSRHLLGYRRAGELERRDHALQEVVSSALSLTGPVLESVELKQELGYAGPVSCAGPLLTQALANLLENAAQAAGKGGWVRLASRVEERALVVEVSDSGAGVPRELRERIFEPFFTTKPPGEGTGLGLTTARDIVRRHNGTLDIRDFGDRAVFHIEIPLHPEAGHDRA
jgi:signal transduction histidine kinase